MPRKLPERSRRNQSIRGSGLAAALLALRPALRGAQDRLTFTGAQCLDGCSPLQLRRTLHEESIARPRPHRSESIQHRLEARPSVPLLDQIPLPLREAKPPLRAELQGQQFAFLTPVVDGGSIADLVDFV